MNEYIVNYIFKFINFTVLIGLFVYCFQKYILNIILNGITQQENALILLDIQKKELEQKQFELNIDIEQDKITCNSLKKKIDLWTKQHKINLIHQTNNKTNQLELMYTRLKQSMHTYRKDQAKNKILNTALVFTHNSLKKQFADKKNGQNYLQHIISSLNGEKNEK